MMDKSAIEQIQKAQATAEVQSAINAANLAHPLAAMPSDIKASSLESYMANRVRFRGELQTNSINDFSRFSIENAVDGSSVCFIDPRRECAVAIFNLGNQEVAGHADFKATLHLEKTAEYTALLNVHDSQLKQKQMAEFMEDFADFITTFDSEGNEVSVKRAIGAVRRLVIEANAKAEYEEQDFRSTRSALESVEAKTDNGLPSEIFFKCEPFKELQEHVFCARLSVITGGDEAKFSFRIKRLESKQDEIMEGFKSLLIEKLEGKMPAYIGRFDA